jgi:hypothetical protein
MGFPEHAGRDDRPDLDYSFLLGIWVNGFKALP